MVARVHRSEDGEEHLSGTDVGRRLLAANVLLTCLQRQAVCLVSVGVDGDADQAAGQLTRMLGVHGQVTGVRSAVPHGDTETLGGSEARIRAELTG